MLILNDLLVDEAIFVREFVCDLSVCKGCCCIEGDSGAPITLDEMDNLERYFESAREYMSSDNIKAIEEQGFGVVDECGDLGTTLGPSKECAFVTHKDGMLMCAYERAFLDKKIPWRKPISCYLYPIRITQVGPYKAIKYHRWDICDCALANGEKLGVPCYKFLEDPITEAFGADFYAQLCEVAEAYLESRK
ncbi:MAG: DUF3109 family protein [Bacteroidales bacterium]|nr:DUF3109 family protein [Bacteroidales bacterium]